MEPGAGWCEHPLPRCTLTLVITTEILVRGSIAGTVMGLIVSRFGALAISPAPDGHSTRIAGEMDQSAERALLALLWDTGHDVISMHSTSTPTGDQHD